MCVLIYLSNTIFVDYQSRDKAHKSPLIIYLTSVRRTLLLQTTIVSILMTILLRNSTISNTIVIALINSRPEASPVIDEYFSVESSGRNLAFILDYREKQTERERERERYLKPRGLFHGAYHHAASTRCNAPGRGDG